MKTKLQSTFDIRRFRFTATGTVILTAITLAATMPYTLAQTWGNALTFDGADDYVVVANFGSVVPTNEVTVEFWQRVHQVKSQSTFSLDPEQNPRFQAHVPFNNGYVFWDFGDINNGGRLSYLPTNSLVGTWQHFAFVAKAGPGGHMKIYRNGVLEAQKTGAASPSFGNYNLILGMTPNYFFDGDLDEFRIWSVERSQAQIQAGMVCPLTGGEANLVGYWKFDEASGTRAYDATTNHFDAVLAGTVRSATGVLERSLALAVDAPQYSWSTSGNNTWWGQTIATHDGVDAARSGTIADGQTSTFQATVPGPTTLIFWQKVSSEAGFDFLTCYVDNVLKTEISGEVGWERRTIDLAAGNHTVRWTYSKDGSLNHGQDAGWVDQVETSPLPLALDAPQFEWTTSGNANWFYQTSVRHDGVDAARSGAITHNQASTVETTVTGPGVLNFWWKVSSESGWDYLRYYLDGSSLGQISGEVDWQLKTVCVPAGSHTVRWTFSKDVIDTEPIGSNAGFLDQVTWSPGTLNILTEPVGQVAYMGGTVRFSVVASGPAALSYQWRLNGTNLVNGGRLSGATSTNLVISSVVMPDVGNYSVLAYDSCNSALSANAALAVGNLGSLFDDFEPSIHPAQWSSFSGTVLATNYGGSVSGVKSLWFGGDGPRFAVSRPLMTTSGGVVDFYLRIANGASSPWEYLDLPSKGIVLEYSTDGGSVWVEMGRFAAATYYNWTHVSVTIPVAAQTFNTQFRWRQLSHSGNLYDHWALDDVASITLPPPATLTGCAVSAPGQFRLQGVGTAGLTYTVQTSSNLVDWVDHNCILAGPGGLIICLDDIETNAPACFYRLKWP